MTSEISLAKLELYFQQFRKNVIGMDQKFTTHYGEKTMVYADWTASGRLYRPIEELITNEIGPFVGNTHTETSITGTTMTNAYHLAQKVIKEHVHADKNDVLITTGSGMTGAAVKFQRILGLKLHEKFKSKIQIPENERPVIFVTHMEHHSNQTSWEETIADVIVLEPDGDGLIDLDNLRKELKRFADRPMKIAAVSACSNVTGIITPYHQIAAVMHENGGLCFVDFACSAPYIDMNMHPGNPLQKLDAIYFSPHKFLGGPGTTGVVIFDKALYKLKIPDEPGGGTVKWTNPWGKHEYLDDIEAREDGGTPAFLQTIKTALAIRLKEQMQVKNIVRREHEIVKLVWEGFKNTPDIHVMHDNIKERLCVFAFYFKKMHYNLGVRLLNDMYGIQVRGGCSCAGTYGHYLFGVGEQESDQLVGKIMEGDCSDKPGWIRLSIHPVQTNEEVRFIMNAIKDIAVNGEEYAKDYTYDKHTNEFYYHGVPDKKPEMVERWFAPKS